MVYGAAAVDEVDWGGVESGGCVALNQRDGSFVCIGRVRRDRLRSYVFMCSLFSSKIREEMWWSLRMRPIAGLEQGTPHISCNLLRVLSFTKHSWYLRPLAADGLLRRELAVV